MEIKINREIRDYTESVFFGLSLRQLIFSLLACGVAVGLYFALRPFFGLETLSWVCILGAVPFGALGYLRYNGMSAEQFLWAYIKSTFLTPKVLLFRPVNIYAAGMEELARLDKLEKRNKKEKKSRKAGK